MKFAIIGSGPAGSSAAYYLAKDGHEVILIDPKGPNEKTCGGGVPSKCLQRFPEFYNDFHPAENLVEKMTFAFDGKDLCEIAMPKGMGIFSRKNHDNHIFQKALTAGATYLKETFKDCENVGDQWRLKTDQQEFTVDFILGADGAVSRVRNKLANKLPRQSYFKGVDYLVSKPGLPLHIGFDKKLNGYLWVFPRENNCSIGIVDFDDDQSLRMKFLNDYLARFNVSESEIIKKRSALIPSLQRSDLKEHQISGKNWALVGDAAALAEPITGEGIYYAIYSSWLFAECLRKKEDYNKCWRQEFRQIVQEAHISRTSYKFLNRSFMKFFLGRSEMLRRMTGEHLAAFKPGRTHRMKFFMSLPLIAVQAIFSKPVKL
jgi:geranylgeranyl reductase family protein